MAVANLLAYNLIVIKISSLGHSRVQEFGIGNPENVQLPKKEGNYESTRS